MSDRMTPMHISQLVEWVMNEKKKHNTVFGIHHPYQAADGNRRMIFGRMLETPVGPAAGPHTQLAQNIVSAYYAGGRFFELKTVQIMDGEELSACVKKPCITAEDECYNVEWSTELYVPQAMEEYIKSWFLLHIMAREFELGAAGGFQFNMSVGYDLEGIKSEKIDTFLESMKEAKDTQIFKECRQYLLDHVDLFEKVTVSDIEQISSQICNSVTLSTLHGCPPQEIERIASYLIEEKGLHTFIKCNPTLLGYPYARQTLDEMGYDYISFGDFHFLDDLQYQDAVPMLKRLSKKSQDKKLEFGVKITNTFPVDIKANELPGDEMYMSGRALFPLSMAVAARLTEDFGGELRISYSGGADSYNIKNIVDAGIWPVTVATTLLKPGGYQRMKQLAEVSAEVGLIFDGVSKEKTRQMAEGARTDQYYLKPVKPKPVRKMKKRVPLTDCFTAPCQEGCPIHQDITAYLELAEAEKYEEALKVILEKNPLPFITGTICPHRCMSKCTRNFYEEPVSIRDTKLLAADRGYQTVLKEIKAKEQPLQGNRKAAVVGGGPSGMAAAYFLLKGGLKTTIFEKQNCLGGIVKNVIPDFRIEESAIQKDIDIIRALGVEVQLNTTISSVQELKEAGYDFIVLAVGAQKAGMLRLEKGESVNALQFLKEYKETKGKMSIGQNVVVIGGGNTAMDTARAAKRTKGVEHVYLVYRRTKRYMPADEEELLMALEEGVEFRELLSPQKLEDGKLFCNVMELDQADDSGRRSVKTTGSIITIPADIVIAATGEGVSSEFLQDNQLALNSSGSACVNEKTLESSSAGVYVIGDGLNGPATVVEGIRDASKAAADILGQPLAESLKKQAEPEIYYNKRGVLKEYDTPEKADGRCLGCAVICENCVEACPNRANVSVLVPELKKNQVIHVDSMCNECGNCKTFCPYDSAPYLDKFTLFANEKDMQDSENQGFVVLNDREETCKVRYQGNVFVWQKGQDSGLPKELCLTIERVCASYQYLWK